MVKQVAAEHETTSHKTHRPAKKHEDLSAEIHALMERAEHAEAELALLKAHQAEAETRNRRPVETGMHTSEGSDAHAAHALGMHGLEALRQDAMMKHLLDSLDAGTDIGHYGRLTFCMVARHFLSEEEVIAQLTKDQDFPEGQAEGMLRQVCERNYNPPRRERLLEWQQEQEFPIIPEPHDPDCGNVYRSLKFPTKTYKQIEHYQEERSEA